MGTKNHFCAGGMLVRSARLRGQSASPLRAGFGALPEGLFRVCLRWQRNTRNCHVRAVVHALAVILASLTPMQALAGTVHVDDDAVSDPGPVSVLKA